MTKPDEFFEDIYKLTTMEQSAEHYAKFAAQYDEAVREAGYVTPGRCVEALKAHGADPAQAVLDAGCGSGLSGLALRGCGFETIDGLDYSDEMLDQAREKGIYRNLMQGDLSQPNANLEAGYPTVMAAGVLNPAHAPPEALDHILAMLKPGGLFVFSLNDHAIAAHSFEGRLNMLIDCAAADLLWRDYGDHLTNKDLKAWVYVLKKR